MDVDVIRIEIRDNPLSGSNPFPITYFLREVANPDKVHMVTVPNMTEGLRADASEQMLQLQAQGYDTDLDL